MKQIEPEFRDMHDPKQIAPILNISENEIDSDFPIQDVSTGLEFTMIPLKRLQAIKSAHTNLEHYKKYFKGREPKPLFIFCPETYDGSNQINCRMFADLFGIPEDPATGSANGCLAGYLIKYNYFNKSEISIRVEQGIEIGRKSILHLHARSDNNRIDVKVGGKVFRIAEGILV
jgi:trans-2,3-dihydro-3-hydroxyanthranilate isomerase